MKGAPSFVFDANRCTGCGACRVACTIENRLAPADSWRRIETFNPRHHPMAPVFHLSTACHHCADAACMNACPALAYRRDAPTGAVLLDSDLCIGCGYCSWACPYDAPVFNETAGVMTKCTWCVDRLHAGLKPACATHCPTGALDYADVPAGERVIAMEGLSATALGPSLHVIPLKPGRLQPEMTEGAGFTTDVAQGFSPAQISLRREWPLAAFTYGTAVLVGLVTGAAAGAYAFPAWAFALAAAAVMGVTGAHLGRKARAWRAILNLRRSWLSREVAAISLFAGLATLWLLIAPENRVLGWTAALVGFAGLLSVDQVYGVLPSGPGHRHSAGVTSTGVLLAALFAGWPRLAAVVLALKLGFYVARWWSAARTGARVPPWLFFVRVASGFAAPLLIWLATAPGHPAAIPFILIGELIDRGEYYLTLERQSPRREMDRALSQRVVQPRAAGPVAGLQAYTDAP